MYIAGFLLVLGPLVTVHELGHYLVGRWFGVGADAFSIGFGKELYGWTDKRGTRWKVSAIPLGGYVQFRGDMNPASIPEEGGAVSDAAPKDSFQRASLWKRALIVFAGPATNLLVAVGIFAAFFAILGKPNVIYAENSTEVGEFAEVSPAREAGMQVGDRIVRIDGQEIDSFGTLVDSVKLYPGRDIVIGVDRDGTEIEFPVTIARETEKDRFGNDMTIGRIGVAPASQERPTIEYEEVGVLASVGLAVDECIRITRLMITGIKQIIVGDRSFQELGGPIKIAKFSGEQLSLGPLAFISFAALISLNLAFINLLPIPALDGGHLAFYAAEAVRRKPVGPRGQEWAYRFGIGLVLALMVVVTVNDLVTLPVFGS